MTETPIATDDPEPGTCKQCGEKVPPTKPRSDEAFAGMGRPRAFCDARCRKRFSRAKMPTRYPDNGNGRREGLRERRVSIAPPNAWTESVKKAIKDESRLPTPGSGKETGPTFSRMLDELDHRTGLLARCAKCGRELGEHDGKKCPPKAKAPTKVWTATVRGTKSRGRRRARAR